MSARDGAEGRSVLEGVFINNKRAHLATGSLYVYLIGVINDSTGIDFLENYRVPLERPVARVLCVALRAARGVCPWIIRAILDCAMQCIVMKNWKILFKQL